MTADTAGKSHGLLEGVSRAASQVCVYALEFQKTQLQVHGHIPRLTPAEWMQHMSRGMLSSALTAGMVYGTYFSVYNTITDKLVAGMAATVATSLIKIPISNSMRVLQSGNYPHVLSSGRAILRAQGFPGIYKGYVLSLVDDYLDMECRIRVYTYLRALVPEGQMNHHTGLVMGAITGSIAAAITTPFDTVRCHMAVSSTHKSGTGLLKTISHMYQMGGPPVFVRGIGYRASSNALRTALFCMFYEMLCNQCRPCKK